MNPVVMDYLERKMTDQDAARRRSMDRRDYEDDYRDDYESDSRRGVKGTGRGHYRRDRRDRADYESDSRGYRRGSIEYENDGDYADYGEHHEPLHLTKSDLKHWKHKLENSDGTKGEHYDMQQIMSAAERLGIRFNHYDEKEFCMAVNMMYSDYGHVIKKHMSPDKELMCCAELAKAFLEDPDAPDASEKLALYYHCIVCSGDV